MPHNHRRRIKTEEKAKVVAAVWGTELIQLLGTLAILHTDDLKKEMNSSYSVFFISWPKYLALQGIESILAHKQQWRPLPSLLPLSFFCGFFKSGAFSFASFCETRILIIVSRSFWMFCEKIIFCSAKLRETHKLRKYCIETLKPNKILIFIIWSTKSAPRCIHKITSKRNVARTQVS